MMNDKIPLILVTGYLGSGKTTFLKRILNEYADQIKLGIVQNEFSPSDIDGKELQKYNKQFELLSINKGSVFCVCLIADFRKILMEFTRKYNPGLLILEATGLADPLSIAEILQSPELEPLIYLQRSWCIVDGGHFCKMINQQTRIQHQLRVADEIIVNKNDLLVDSKERVKQLIQDYNPFAKIHFTTYCSVPLNIQDHENTQEPVALRNTDELNKLAKSGRPDIGSMVIRSSRNASKTRVTAYFKNYSSNLQRVKGTVKLNNNNYLYVQSCFGHTMFEEQTGLNVNTELIVLGEKELTREFSRNFLKDVTH